MNGIDVAAVFAALKVAEHDRPVLRNATLGDVHRYSIIGCEIELPVHFDLWMMGARHATVTSARHARDGLSEYVYVRVHALPTKHKRIKISKLDWDYCKLTKLPVGGKLFREPNSGE